MVELLDSGGERGWSARIPLPGGAAEVVVRDTRSAGDIRASAAIDAATPGDSPPDR